MTASYLPQITSLRPLSMRAGDRHPRLHALLQVCGQHYDPYPLHSVYLDWNFKMGHLRAADKSGRVEDVGTTAPANARYFIPDAEVVDHLSLRASSLPLPDDGKLCSDFKADKVNARRQGNLSLASPHITQLVI